MKKVILFILIFTILSLSLNFVYADDTTPDDVIIKYNNLNVSKKFLTYSNNVYTIHVPTEPNTIVYNTSQNQFYPTSSATLYKSTDNGNTWSTSSVSSFYAYHPILYSNFNVNNADSGVFFSLTTPPEPWNLEIGLSSFVQNVAIQSKNILVVAVGILALIMGISLMPRVLYRL